MAGNKVRVVARIRPLSAQEKAAQGCAESPLRKLQGKTALVQVRSTADAPIESNKWFELDAVLEGHASQADLYEMCGAQHAVQQDLLQGLNTSILAYGQTSSGKTYSMGTACHELDDESAGIIPRACNDLFATIREKCIGGKAQVTLSYIELYNEEIRDLFAAETNTKLRIRESADGSVEVKGCVEKEVASPAEIGQLMAQAAKRRVVASTAMNATSSRSHAICTLRIWGAVSNDINGPTTFSSKLTLVDLAGSERIKKTGAQGARQTEGININKSLLVLGQVISALASPTAGRKPPYRDSKLTRLLQDCLGGNSRTILVACVSPAQTNVEETMNTLRYAASARRITNRARPNVVLKATNVNHEQVAALKQENVRLHKENTELNQLVLELQQQLRREQQHQDKRTNSPDRTAKTLACSDDDDTDGSDAVMDEDDQSERSHVPQQIKCEDHFEEMKTRECTERSEHPEQDESTKLCRVVKDHESSENDIEQTPPTQKTENDYILDISNYKLIIAELKERLDFYELLEAQNEELHRDLADAKAEADTAQMAASYLSDIVDELRDIKQGEIEKKRLKLQMNCKERRWISYVHGMLENFRANIAQLANTFDDTVVRKIEDLKFGESSDDTSSCSDSVESIKEERMNDEPVQDVQRALCQEDLLLMAVEKPKSRLFFSRHKSVTFPHKFSSRSLWGATPVVPPNVHSWKECTARFRKEILRVERMTTAEAESIKSIQSYLAKECNALEKEIDKRQTESDSLFANPNKEGHQNELVDQLSSMLFQRKITQSF